MNEKVKEDVIICKNCGKRINIEKYEVINSIDDYNLKQDIIEMDFSKYTCNSCNYINYLEYPLIYIDDKNKIVIVKDDYIGLIAKKEEIINEVKAYVKKDYKIIGASSLLDLRNKILLIDYGYDYRIGTLLLFGGLQEAKYECHKLLKEKKEFYMGRCELILDEESNELFVALIGKKYLTNEAKILGIYNIKDLKQIMDEYEKFLPILDKINPFLFDLTSASKLINTKLEDLEDLKKAIYKFAIIENNEYDQSIAYVCPFNSSKIDIGDEVYTIDKKEPKKAIVIETFYMSDFDMPYEINNLPFVGYKKEDFNIDPVDIKSEDLDNTKILEDLVKYKDSGYRMNLLDIDLLDNLNVLAGFSNNSSDSNSTILYHNKDKAYLTMYTSNDKVVYKEGYDLKVYEFLDILKVIYYFPDFFDGIVINPKNEEIIMSNKMVYRYKSERCLANHNTMVKLLPLLTKEEIDFVGREKYTTICKVYLENKTPKDIIKEENITDKEIDHRLSEGYGRLRRVFECNY